MMYLNTLLKTPYLLTHVRLSLPHCCTTQENFQFFLIELLSWPVKTLTIRRIFQKIWERLVNHISQLATHSQRTKLYFNVRGAVMYFLGRTPNHPTIRLINRSAYRLISRQMNCNWRLSSGVWGMLTLLNRICSSSLCCCCHNVLTLVLI